MKYMSGGLEDVFDPQRNPFDGHLEQANAANHGKRYDL